MIRTSVIMPVYNAGRYLEEAIESILSQTDESYEVIFVDDGSDDESPEILERYLETQDNFYLFHQAHQFQGAARNLGLQKAKGAYVFFMDADDLIAPTLFSECYALCEEKNLDAVLFDAEEFSEDGTALDGFYDRGYLNISPEVCDGRDFWLKYFNRGGVLFTCWSHYARRDFLIKNGIRFGSGYLYEDNEWTIQLYLQAERLQYSNQKLYRYRRRNHASTTGNLRPEQLLGQFMAQLQFQRIMESCVGDGQKETMIHDAYKLIFPTLRTLSHLQNITEYEEGIRTALGELSGRLLNERSPAVQDMCAGLITRILYALRELPLSEQSLQGYRRAAEAVRKYYCLGKTPVIFYGLGTLAEQWHPMLDILKGESDKPFVYMETNPNQLWFRGARVSTVQELENIRPAGILLTSFKYREEITAVIREKTTEMVPIRILW